MDQEDHVKAIKDELAAIAAIPDRLERARAATAALQLLTAANGELARLRREDIVVLHAGGEGMTFRDIGDEIGIDRTRVKQIESGRPTGNSSRSRAAKASGHPQPQAAGNEEA